MNLKRILSLILVIACLSASFAMTAVAASSMTLKTTASVNLREGPGTSYEKITTASSGKSFPYLGISAYDAGGMLWHKVSYKNASAWISAKYSRVTVDGSKLDNAAYVKATASVNLRKGAGTSYKVLSSVSANTKLFYLGEKKAASSGRYWYKVASPKGVAWVSAAYSKLSTASTPADSYIQTTGNVYLRKGAGLGYEAILVIDKGETATYLGESSVDGRGVRWYKVKYAGKTGWVSSRYSKLK